MDRILPYRHVSGLNDSGRGGDVSGAPARSGAQHIISDHYHLGRSAHDCEEIGHLYIKAKGELTAACATQSPAVARLIGKSREHDNRQGVLATEYLGELALHFPKAHDFRKILYALVLNGAADQQEQRASAAVIAIGRLMKSKALRCMGREDDLCGRLDLFLEVNQRRFGAERSLGLRNALLWIQSALNNH